MSLLKNKKTLLLSLIAIILLVPATSEPVMAQETTGLKVVRPAKNLPTVQPRKTVVKPAQITKATPVQPQTVQQVVQVQTQTKQEVKGAFDFQITSPVKTWADVAKRGNSKRLALKQIAEEKIGASYSQPNRMAQGSYDCSSYVHRVLEELGYDKINGNAFTTYTMINSPLLEEIKPGELRPGDLVLGDGHVAFYWGLDETGAKTSLEATPNFGVSKGFIHTNGWNFQYTSAWRIKNIDKA